MDAGRRVYLSPGHVSSRAVSENIGNASCSNHAVDWYYTSTLVGEVPCMLPEYFDGSFPLTVTQWYKGITYWRLRQICGPKTGTEIKTDTTATQCEQMSCRPFAQRCHQSRVTNVTAEFVSTRKWDWPTRFRACHRHCPLLLVLHVQKFADPVGVTVNLVNLGAD